MIMLVTAMMLGNLDFTELFQVVDRPDGYDWVELIERSVTRGGQKTWSSSDGTSAQQSTGTQWADQTGAQTNWGRGTAITGGESEAKRQGSHDKTEGKQKSTATNESAGGGLTKTTSAGGSMANTVGKSHTATVGGSESESETEALKHLPLARTREEWHPTGKLRQAINDQFWRMKTNIAVQAQRQAFMKRADLAAAVAFEVVFVDDPFPDPLQKQAVLHDVKQKIFALHGYYRTPDMSPAEQDSRLDEFLREHQPDDSATTREFDRRTRTIIDQPAGIEEPFAE